ncbi:MAG: DUF5071 domain-containing protein [Clostridia bacterium]|nr:DUF5071 domain-containing protein [Clostridia bacterium]
MIDVTEILDMIDWNMPLEIQSKGVFLAKKVETIAPFIQPVTPKYNKNVWKNCAVIIADKNDEKLKPHLVELLEWLQDMNWPGAFCILERLQKYLDTNAIHSAIIVCIEKAKELNDEVWEKNLQLLLSS